MTGGRAVAGAAAAEEKVPITLRPDVVSSTAHARAVYRHFDSRLYFELDLSRLWTGYVLTPPFPLTSCNKASSQLLGIWRNTRTQDPEDPVAKVAIIECFNSGLC